MFKETALVNGKELAKVEGGSWQGSQMRETVWFKDRRIVTEEGSGSGRGDPTQERKMVIRKEA